MAEDFRGGESGDSNRNWQNSPRNRTFISGGSSAACSARTDVDGSFGWSSDMVDDIVATPSSVSVSDTPTSLFPDPIQKQQLPTAAGNRAALMDSTLPMTPFALSSPTPPSDLNSAIMQWSPKDYSTENVSRGGGGGGSEDSTLISPLYKPLINLNQGVPLDRHRNILDDCTAAFPMGSASYGHHPSSTLLQSDDLLDRNRSSPVLNYYTSDQVPSPAGGFLKPTFPKELQQTADHDWQLSNRNAASPPWSNGSTTLPGAGFTTLFSHRPSLPPPFQDMPNLRDLYSAKPIYSTEEEVQDAVSAKTTVGGETLFKRSRTETPSPMSTFKVRKEKMGDRITTLQQLVSPFGKTDTASVLHEANEYIKFLHDQVSVLTTPYMKNGTPIQSQQQHANEIELQDGEARMQDLRSQGLCLVQLPNTFPAANETSTADFWAPAFGFGGTFRPPN